VAWGLVVLLASLTGGLLFAYHYVTDSDTLAALIRQELPRFFPQTQVDVARVTVRPLVGDCEVKQVTLWQVIAGRPIAVLRTPYLRVSQDVNSLLRGEFHPREVAIAQPTLRLTRREDGSWNLQGLIADPWPGPPLTKLPVVRIENGTVELAEGSTPDRDFVPILRELSIRVEPAEAPGQLTFRGSARGEGAFDRVTLEGNYDTKTGRLELTKGDLTRLSIAGTLRRLPADYRTWVAGCKLTAGDVQVSGVRLVYEPSATPALRYSAAIDLHDGACASSPELPFPLENITAEATFQDGELTIEHARGQNGKTLVRCQGTVAINLETGPLDNRAAGDPARLPVEQSQRPGRLDLTLTVDDLELDERLRAWTPPDLAPLWGEYQPSGRVDVSLRARRAADGEPIALETHVVCRDVAMEYFLFPYPLEHLWGTLRITSDRIDVDLGATVGNRPASCRGTIHQPGPDPHVTLDFAAEGLPIDENLLQAMPAEIRSVIEQFHPTGSVRGTAHLERSPSTPQAPDGIVAITTELILDEQGRCSIVWDGLPYPITNLTGRLHISPDHWTFENMKGRNGVAVIQGHGRVDQRPGGLKVDLNLTAMDLPFDQQLYRALPENWRRSWDILNPVGSSRVTARIQLEPGRPDHYHLDVIPTTDTRVQLKFQPVANPSDAMGAAQPTLQLPPMERVGGHFVFDDGNVVMRDVSFRFRGSPVRFPFGTVRVEDDGRFDLRVKDLHVTDFRLDAGLRQLMPPVMAQFAQRLDEGRTLTLRTDLGLGWQGEPGQPAWCAWENGLVVFTGNTIQAGLALEFIQGQLDQLQGRFDGHDLGVTGRLNLASISVLDQQITGLTGQLSVARGQARLNDIEGALLGGTLRGWVNVDLDATPKYATALELEGADLRRLTRTLPGRQDVRGLVSGRVQLEGTGNDLKTLQGHGEGHVVEAELGELPFALRFFKFLQISSPMKRSAPPHTAFDSADARFRIQDGQALIDPIQLTGDAFSLHGRGTVELTGDLDLRLRVLYGRDRLHLGRLSDAMREASGRILDVRVTGPAALPQYKLEALPQATDIVRRSLMWAEPTRDGPD
jgi:hypothetical protein